MAEKYGIMPDPGNNLDNGKNEERLVGNKKVPERDREMEKSVTKEVRIGLLDFNAEVKMGGNQVSSFSEDVDHEGFISYDDDEFSSSLAPLHEAGVETDYRPWVGEEGEDVEGYLSIKKEDLNNAIDKKRIKFIEDQGGRLELELASSKELWDNCDYEMLARRLRGKVGHREGFHSKAGLGDYSYDVDEVADFLEMSDIFGNDPDLKKIMGEGGSKGKELNDRKKQLVLDHLLPLAMELPKISFDKGYKFEEGTGTDHGFSPEEARSIVLLTLATAADNGTKGFAIGRSVDSARGSDLANEVLGIQMRRLKQE